MVREGITIDGLVRARATLDSLLRRTRDLTPLMERFGAYGEESSRYRFESQEGPDGQRWEPSIRAKEKGGQTLKDSGGYESSITWRATRTTAEWGTNWPFAHVHQEGMTIRAKGGGRMTFNIPGLGFRSAQEVVIPARPVFGISAEDEAEIDAILYDYVAEALQ